MADAAAGSDAAHAGSSSGNGQTPSSGAGSSGSSGGTNGGSGSPTSGGNSGSASAGSSGSASGTSGGASGTSGGAGVGPVIGGSDPTLLPTAKGTCPMMSNLDGTNVSFAGQPKSLRAQCRTRRSMFAESGARAITQAAFTEGDLIDLSAASHLWETRNPTAFIVDCDDGAGRSAQGPRTMMAPQAIQMLWDHPYGITPEPYASGLPADWPATCVPPPVPANH